MERLTKKLPDGRNILTGNFAYVRNPKYGSFVEGYAVDKLSDYEDADEQGLLLKLPCKVGDTVWWITPNCIVLETKFDDSMIRRLDLFGKVFFTTKEEAEQALKRMEGE